MFFQPLLHSIQFFVLHFVIVLKSYPNIINSRVSLFVSFHELLSRKSLKRVKKLHRKYVFAYLRWSFVLVEAGVGGVRMTLPLTLVKINKVLTRLLNATNRWVRGVVVWLRVVPRERALRICAAFFDQRPRGLIISWNKRKTSLGYLRHK